MGGDHMGKKSYQSQASSSSSMFNAEELGYFENNGICVAHGRKTRMMEKVQSMLKAKESGNDEVFILWLMVKKKEKKMNEVTFKTDESSFKNAILIAGEDDDLGEVKMEGRRTDRDLVDVFCMKYEDVW
ncbi:hypothetical protein MTR_6g093160 [Medicago truncatula]|uniref:Uncharacterized protein n=1 Tax=Medicago truncatula TaxID=3880 RepID=A0A072UDV7_MEDTR|nr:hypothetical protein MTR_6g093160 [Medicago truncatula]